MHTYPSCAAVSYTHTFTMYRHGQPQDQHQHNCLRKHTWDRLLTFWGLGGWRAELVSQVRQRRFDWLKALKHLSVCCCAPSWVKTLEESLLTTCLRLLMTSTWWWFIKLVSCLSHLSFTPFLLMSELSEAYHRHRTLLDTSKDTLNKLKEAMSTTPAQQK